MRAVQCVSTRACLSFVHVRTFGVFTYACVRVACVAHMRVCAHVRVCAQLIEVNTRGHYLGTGGEVKPDINLVGRRPCCCCCRGGVVAAVVAVAVAVAVVWWWCRGGGDGWLWLWR